MIFIKYIIVNYYRGGYLLTAPLHPLGLLIIFLEPLTGAASPLRPRRQPEEVWAHHLLSSPTPNTKKLYTKKPI